jgi:DNA-binding LacI/PurR family transcriptional regulator
VIAEAQKRGLSVLIEPTASSRQREKEVLDRVRGQFGDGIIYCPLEIDPEELRRIDVGNPMVVLSEPHGEPKYDHVVIRNREAAQAATEHLIQGGSHRIAAVGVGAGQTRGLALQRLLGYRDALTAHGIPCDPKLEVVTDAWHRSDGAVAIDRLSQDGITFDGVFAFTDQLASGVLHALQVNGYQIPRDVAVVGFDNNDESKYLVPPLTTIDPGIDEIAARAVDILSKRIGEKDGAEHGVAKVSFRLIQRESSREIAP